MNFIYKPGIYLFVKTMYFFFPLLSSQCRDWEVWSYCVHVLIFPCRVGQGKRIGVCRLKIEQNRFAWESGGCGCAHGLGLYFCQWWRTVFPNVTLFTTFVVLRDPALYFLGKGHHLIAFVPS